MCMTKLYKFVVGDAATDPLAMSVRVWANSADEALAKANAALQKAALIHVFGPNGMIEGADAANVYFAPRLTLADLAGAEMES